MKSDPRLILFSFLLNFKVFLRGIHPDVIDCHFFKPFQPSSLPGLLSPEEVAVRDSARVASGNAIFELLLLHLSA